MMKINAGACVCGQVQFTTQGDPERVTICHCTWCQRRTGSAFGVEVVFKDDKVTIDGETHISVHRHVSDESGRWIDSHFCSQCGTNIGMRLEAVPGIRTIAAGTFENPSWIDSADCPTRYVYIRSAQNWSALPEGAEYYEEHFRM